MYAAFFRLQREPFSIAPDPHFLFMSEAHREALAHLLYGVSGGGGFVLLTGEIGAGKTTVCRCFLDQVPSDTDVAYVFNPKLEVLELLKTVCDEFRISVPETAATVKDYVDRLNAFLLDSHARGRHAVLIIDEAQSLSAPVLEQLRLLTNLETAERKLLQIILIGQPELRTMLERPELEQLAQRVIARYHLPALSAGETAQYVRHRLTVAGLAGEVPFEVNALARIHQLTRGVPRRVNLLADRALLGGYASGRTRIDRAIVDRAALEVFGRPSAPEAPARRALPPWAWATAWAAGGAAVSAAVAGLAWATLRDPAPAVPPAPVAAVSPSAAPVEGPAMAASAPAAASMPASAAAPVAVAVAPKPAASADLGPLAAAALTSEAEAWRSLAARWPVELAAGEPCAAASRQQLACFRGSAGFAQLRELNRPLLLTLRDSEGRPRWLVLTALDADGATLAAGGVEHTVTPTALTGLWRGEYATLWRTPPGWREPPAEVPAPPLAAWLSQHLPGTPDQPLRARLNAFQVAQGLKPDGVAGPLTLMQLNRTAGVEEPQLAK